MHWLIKIGIEPQEELSIINWIPNYVFKGHPSDIMIYATYYHECICLSVPNCTVYAHRFVRLSVKQIIYRLLLSKQMIQYILETVSWNEGIFEL